MSSLSSSSSSSLNSSCSCSSQPSSVAYSHEPFDTFIDKVRALLHQLFPSAYATSTAVYRLQGGSFHRVIAADLLNRGAVIRIPRFEYVSLSDEAVVLSFVRSHSEIPVPRVLKLDISSSNVLGDPYMVQVKVPGDKLYHIYPTMTFDEKRAVIQQVAHLLGQMYHIPMQSIGVLRENIDDRQRVVIGPFKDHPDPDEHGIHPSPGADLPSFLATRFNFYINFELAQNSHAKYIPSFMYAFLEAARDLVPVPNSRIVLHHTDFHSRNIMVARREGTGEYQVTALLDWEKAVAVPVEMAFSMPSFLWEEQSGSESSNKADDVSKLVERGCELQSFFEDEIVRLIPDFFGHH